MNIGFDSEDVTSTWIM